MQSVYFFPKTKAEFVAVAAEIGALLKPMAEGQRIIVFMGSKRKCAIGKTTFAKAMASGLGIQVTAGGDGIINPEAERSSFLYRGQGQSNGQGEEMTCTIADPLHFRVKSIPFSVKSEICGPGMTVLEHAEQPDAKIPDDIKPDLIIKFYTDTEQKDVIGLPADPARMVTIEIAKNVPNAAELRANLLAIAIRYGATPH